MSQLQRFMQSYYFSVCWWHMRNSGNHISRVMGSNITYPSIHNYCSTMEPQWWTMAANVTLDAYQVTNDAANAWSGARPGLEKCIKTVLSLIGKDLAGKECKNNHLVVFIMLWWLIGRKLVFRGWTYTVDSPLRSRPGGSMLGTFFLLWWMIVIEDTCSHYISSKLKGTHTQ